MKLPATADAVGDVFREAAGLGVELRADGGRLRFRPVAVVGPKLRARLAEHKDAILARLTTRAPADPAAPRLLYDAWCERWYRPLDMADPTERALAAWIADGRRELANAEALARAGRDARGFTRPQRYERGETFAARSARWRREVADKRTPQ